MLLFSTIIFLFILWRGILTLKCKWYWKCAAGVVLFCGAYKFRLLHLFGGPMYFAPVLPRWILFTGTVMFSIVFIIFFLLLFAEIFRAGYRIYLKIRKKSPPPKWDAFCCWSNLGILVAAVILAIIGMYCGSAAPQVTYFTPEIKDLPSSARNLRIVLVCDIHLSPQSSDEYVKNLVAQVNKLAPDVVILGGDLVDGNTATLGDRIMPLRDLQAKHGVYAVYGNHEYYSGLEEWKNFLREKCNIVWLENSHVEVRGIAIAGVTDKAAAKKGGDLPNVAQAVRKVPEDMPVILAAHRPDIAQEAEKFWNIRLQLSGHTHGGMITGFDRLIALANGGYVSGAYKKSDKFSVYVSNGTGIWQGFPVRLGKNAEITLIELK